MWPALSTTFGIHPWDVGRLSIAEIHQYVWFLEDQAEHAKRG